MNHQKHPWKDKRSFSRSIYPGPTLFLPIRMDDLFKKLCVGARFSQSDRILEKKILKSKIECTNSTITEVNLPDELNFFAKSKDTSNTSLNKNTRNIPKIKIPTKPLFKNDTAKHVFCKKKSIKVYGSEIPTPVRKFVDLARPEYGVQLELIGKIMESAFTRPTPVQMQATPVLLAGRDAFIIAPTGSGKTLVFVLALITKLLSKGSNHLGIQAIVISPTRELAQQTKDEFRKFIPLNNREKPMISSVLLNKAVLNSWQMISPRRPPEILISTPKRLVQAIETKTVDLSHVRHIILDEADRLLELGLMEQLDDILSACTFSDGPIQKALLSATIPTGIEQLARSFMNEDPIKVVIGTPNAATLTIEQKLIFVGQEEGKLLAIRQMLTDGIEPPVIIFVETIERATILFHELVKHGITVDIIHGNRTQAERERVVAQFRAGRIWFLITTDLLARGLDFPKVACVINYDFPLSTASYIHRIGRTGRAGKAGKAITFYTREDADALKIVANVMGQSKCDVPNWMLQLRRKSNKYYQRERSKRRCINDCLKANNK